MARSPYRAFASVDRKQETLALDTAHGWPTETYQLHCDEILTERLAEITGWPKPKCQAIVVNERRRRGG